MIPDSLYHFDSLKVFADSLKVYSTSVKDDSITLKDWIGYLVTGLLLPAILFGVGVLVGQINERKKELNQKKKIKKHILNWLDFFYLNSFQYINDLSEFAGELFQGKNNLLLLRENFIKPISYYGIDKPLNFSDVTLSEIFIFGVKATKEDNLKLFEMYLTLVEGTKEIKNEFLKIEKDATLYRGQIRLKESEITVETMNISRKYKTELAFIMNRFETSAANQVERLTLEFILRKKLTFFSVVEQYYENEVTDEHFEMFDMEEFKNSIDYLKGIYTEYAIAIQDLSSILNNGTHLLLPKIEHLQNVCIAYEKMELI